MGSLSDDEIDSLRLDFPRWFIRYVHGGCLAELALEDGYVVVEKNTAAEMRERLKVHEAHYFPQKDPRREAMRGIDL